MEILKLQPIFKDYIWGGQRLREDFGFQSDLPKLAEGWMLACHQAGMNTIDLAACSPISKLLMSVLQFIGAAPGSTGGGVKVTTFAVLILTIRSVAQGRDDCVIGGHHIESKTVYRALTIIVIGAVAAFGSAVVVYYNTAETVSVIDCIFESCSAFGTVGLSVGVTGQLNTGAKLLYMACMFMGRVGPVSLVLSMLVNSAKRKNIVYPDGQIIVG